MRDGHSESLIPPAVESAQEFGAAFEAYIANASNEIEFPHEFFVPNEQTRHMHLDHAFLDGVRTALSEDDAEETINIARRAEELAAFVPSSDNEVVDEVRCRKDAELIGYLIGRKVAMRDASYRPGEPSAYEMSSLQQLEAVARRTAPAFIKAFPHSKS